MAETKPSQPRPSGPRVERISCNSFQVLGLDVVSPMFRTRAEGDAWLRMKLREAPASKRPQVRRCLRCGEDFLSQGFHNRMCASCRSHSAGTDNSNYRVIRPASRG